MVPFDLTEDEMQDARSITAGLLLNNFIGPLLKTLERNYEEPLECYKLTGLLF